MKKQSGITSGDWSALYEAATEFKKLKCWDWMHDSDIFGVRDPETGETGYCCVMGSLKEVFALNVYLGAEGLNSYWHIRDQFTLITQGASVNKRTLLNCQKCLMASFEDRSTLHKNDLGVIRNLGVKFRGKNQWPMFRNYKPDFAPWFITGEEVRFLTEALHQTINVALRFKKDPGLLGHPDSETGEYLIRTRQKGKWRDVRECPSAYQPPEINPIINETLVARLKRDKMTRAGAWITDCVILPAVIGERERPYYPYGFPVLSAEGMALDMMLLKPEEVDKELPDKFMTLIQKLQIMPQSVTVGSRRSFNLLKPVAQKLKIQIQQSDRLPELEFFISSMEEFFGG